jgi:hypothetical protein
VRIDLSGTGPRAGGSARAGRSGTDPRKARYPQQRGPVPGPAATPVDVACLDEADDITCDCRHVHGPPLGCHQQKHDSLSEAAPSISCTRPLMATAVCAGSCRFSMPFVKVVSAGNPSAYAYAWLRGCVRMRSCTQMGRCVCRAQSRIQRWSGQVSR